MALDPVYFDRPAQVAENQMAQLWAQTNQALSEFYSTIQGLQNVQFVDGVVAPPTAPDITVAQPFPALPSWEDLTSLVVLDVGALPGFNQTEPDYADTVAAFSGSPPGYSSVVSAFSGEAPQYASTVEAFTASIPEYVQVAPGFDGSAPVFTGSPVSPTLNWGLAAAVDAAFTDQLAAAAALRTTLAQWFGDVIASGFGGLPPALEQALFDRARGRETATALKAEQAATGLWAGKGFSMPQGPQAALVEAAEQQSRLAANSLSRDILDKAADWALGNLRHAVQHGASLSGILVNGAASLVAPSLEGAKAPKEIEVQVYDAAVRLFGEERQVYSTDAATHGQQISVNAAVLGHKMQGFGVQGSAYGQKVSGDSAVLGHKMQGFSVQGSVYGHQVGADTAAFGHAMQGFSVQGTTYGQQMSTNAAIYGHRTQVFSTHGAVYGHTLSAAAEVVRNKLGAVQAAVGKWSAWAEANIKQAEVAIRGSEAQARVNVSANEAQIHQYGLALQRMIQQKEIVQESIKALTGALAQVIGGTLAGAHVSIGVSGQSSLHGSESMSTSFNHNYDETGV
jgi:hypothetical protein